MSTQHRPFIDWSLNIVCFLCLAAVVVRAQVLSAYEAQDSDEIGLFSHLSISACFLTCHASVSLSKGDIVVVLDKSDDDWWQVRTESADRKVGMFPSIYLQQL